MCGKRQPLRKVPEQEQRNLDEPLTGGVLSQGNTRDRGSLGSADRGDDVVESLVAAHDDV